jgi:hypothetical protein
MRRFELMNRWRLIFVVDRFQMGHFRGPSPRIRFEIRICDKSVPDDQLEGNHLFHLCPE